MIVRMVGTMAPELGLEGPAVVLEVTAEEARTMAAHLFQDVSLEGSPRHFCEGRDCDQEPELCLDHVGEEVQRQVALDRKARGHDAKALVQAEEIKRLALVQAEEIKRLARLLLGSLEAERSTLPGHPSGRSPSVKLTDAKARDLAKALG